MAAVLKTPSCHWANVAIAAPLHGIVSWYRVSQERAALRDLPSERLADLGLTRQDAVTEAKRPFWQAKRDI